MQPNTEGREEREAEAKIRIRDQFLFLSHVFFFFFKMLTKRIFDSDYHLFVYVWVLYVNVRWWYNFLVIQKHLESQYLCLCGIFTEVFFPGQGLSFQNGAYLKLWHACAIYF